MAHLAISTGKIDDKDYSEALNLMMKLPGDTLIFLYIIYLFIMSFYKTFIHISGDKRAAGMFAAVSAEDLELDSNLPVRTKTTTTNEGKKY